MKDQKILIIYGPRQSGKTTLLQMLAEIMDEKIRWWNGDKPDQRIENIGLCLKLIGDNIKSVKVIASGSSAFDLANKISEPLTGSKWELFLHHFPHREMALNSNQEEENRLLEKRLIYGYYPDVVTHPGDDAELLRKLSDSYLYKDILTWERIQKPEKLERLDRALALHLGSEVSYNELGRTCSIDNETVEKYISLLEKAFIVFRLPSFSRNLK